MDLREMDLNLLVVFDTLRATGRVAATAKALGLTQPSVSNALARLRRTFDDELFVRTPGGMVPTPLAQRLSGPIAEALATLHGAFNQPAGFDPAAARRTFTVAMTDIGEIHFLPDLMARLAEEAPGVTLSTVRNHSINLRAEMEQGRVDLAIGLLPDLRAGFFQRRLLSQRYVCLFRRGHPLDQPDLSLAAFAAADHLGVVAAGTGHDRVDEGLAKAGIARRIRLRVPHFVALGHILHASDMVATVPEVLAARSAGPFGLTWRPLPVDLPAIDIAVFWHAKMHQDPANRWLRGLIPGDLPGDVPAVVAGALAP